MNTNEHTEVLGDDGEMLATLRKIGNDEFQDLVESVKIQKDNFAKERVKLERLFPSLKMYRCD